MEVTDDNLLKANYMRICKYLQRNGWKHEYSNAFYIAWVKWVKGNKILLTTQHARPPALQELYPTLMAISAADGKMPGQVLGEILEDEPPSEDYHLLSQIDYLATSAYLAQNGWVNREGLYWTLEDPNEYKNHQILIEPARFNFPSTNGEVVEIVRFISQAQRKEPEEVLHGIVAARANIDKVRSQRTEKMLHEVAEQAASELRVIEVENKADALAKSVSELLSNYDHPATSLTVHHFKALREALDEFQGKQKPCSQPDKNTVWQVAKKHHRDYITPEDVADALAITPAGQVASEVLEIIGFPADYNAEDMRLCAFIAWKAIN